MARVLLLLLLIFGECFAGSVYISDSQRFILSDNWKSLEVIDADGAATQYTLAFYIPDISGCEEFRAYVYSSEGTEDKAVTIRKYYSGDVDFMEFFSDNRISAGTLYLERK